MNFIYCCSLLEFTQRLNSSKILKPKLTRMMGQDVTVKDIIIYIIEWRGYTYRMKRQRHMNYMASLFA